MLAAAVNSTFQFSEFLQEMRRAIRRQGHGRLLLTINLEQVMAALPDEIKAAMRSLSTVEDEIRKIKVDAVTASATMARVFKLPTEQELLLNESIAETLRDCISDLLYPAKPVAPSVASTPPIGIP